MIFKLSVSDLAYSFISMKLICMNLYEVDLYELFLELIYLKFISMNQFFCFSVLFEALLWLRSQLPFELTHVTWTKLFSNKNKYPKSAKWKKPIELRDIEKKFDVEVLYLNWSKIG